MKIIAITFRCGHIETLSQAQIRKERVQHDAPFHINGTARALSGQYCLACSTPKPQPKQTPTPQTQH